jgi:DNA polymerase-3 subunit beta
MRVDRRALHSALRQLSRVAGSKSALPVLAHVLLRAGNGTLTLRTTDLTQTLTCTLPAEGELDTCLPAKLLANMVKPEAKTTAGDAILEPADNMVTVQLDDGITRLTALDPTLFPAGSEREWNLLGVWPTPPLRESLSYVLPAASSDSSRPHLCAVFLSGNMMVTTDGHRMHLAPLPAPLETSLLVPTTSAATILHIAGAGEQVVLATSGNRLRVGIGPYQLETKLVDATFPPHEHVVPPRDQPTQITVETRVLAKALSRLDRLSSVRQTTTRVNGILTLTASDPDLGEAEVVLPTISNSHSGDDLVTGFDRVYLRDAIATDTETIELGFSGPLDPVRVDLEGERVAVIMPMRA